ncbi:hypothetical protein [Paenibacillus sp. FSL R7-0333]|uniref:hypothetical protein n=1 Tax=Paenibacillus sp. FSL R7-0333 TaxID=1926587 RepID=UPI00096C5E85|nr:hypothetical protein BK146_20680 [Paenibacillus sp. FSL R7-0333]
MERQGSFIEENVKKLSGNEGYEDVDVKDRVMQRIREIHAGNRSEAPDAAAHGDSVSPPAETGADPEAGNSIPMMQQARTRYPRQRKPRSKTVIAASGLTAVLLLSAAGFGIYKLTADNNFPVPPRTAVEIIESREGSPLTLNNSTGKQVLQAFWSKQGTTPISTPSSAAVKYDDLMKVYEQQAETELGPGEKAVFYIKDAGFKQLADGLGYSTRLFTVSRSLTYNEYGDFAKAWSAIALAGAPLPSSLSGGYSFAKAQIKYDFYISPGTPDYQHLLQTLEAEAQTDTSGKQVFARKLEKDETDKLFITMDFLKDGVTRSFQLNIGSSTINLLPGQSAEKWLIEGKEALFISGVSSGGNQNIWSAANRLIYYNEAANATYTWNDALNRLDKSEWLALTSAFIQ